MKAIILIMLTISALTNGLFAESSICIAGTNFTPVFADNGLSETNKTIICADLERYFSYNGSLNTMFNLKEEAENIQVRTLISSRHNHEIKANITIRNMVSRQLDIPKALSDTYTNLFASIPASTSLLAAATAFIGEFNNGNVTNYSDAAICHLFRTADSWQPLTVTNDIRAGLKSYWTKTKYTQPCIIDYQVGKIWPEREEVRTFLVRSIAVETNELVDTTTYLIGNDGTEWFMLAL